MGQSDTRGDVEAIANVRKEYVQAENAGDVEGILATCAEDIVFIPPESPPVRGKEASREFLGGFLDAFSVELDLQSEGTVVDGDLAYGLGDTPTGGMRRTVTE